MNRSNKQRGSVLAECSAVIPVFVMFFIAIVDASRALNHYFLLSRISYEGARLASATIGLEAGTYNEQTAPNGSIHRALQVRIRDLIETYEHQVGGAVAITTSYQEVDRSIEVRIDESFRPAFSRIFTNLVISTSERGPYLFGDATAVVQPDEDREEEEDSKVEEKAFEVDEEISDLSNENGLEVSDALEKI